MPGHAPRLIGSRRSGPLVALLLIALLAGCGDQAPSASPATPPSSAASPAGVEPTPSVEPVTASPGGEPAATPEPSPTTLPPVARIVPGAIAETVSDRLRIRSAPRVADDSQKYTPLLPVGTQLVVTAGPVVASAYTWFRVAPIGFKLDGGIDQGWVAIADHDGTPWVAPASDPTPGYELAAAVLAQPSGDVAAAKAEAKALNSFGLTLYLKLLRDPEAAIGGRGTVISPASVTLALAMARAGAKGDTASQMDDVLGVSGWSALSSGLGSLSALLASRDAGWSDPWDGTQHQLALRIANMAFAQDGYPIEADYLDRIARAFGSGLGLVDYIRDAETARQAINGWVSRQTLGRIPELLKPPNVTGATRLVLVNAMYLKAEWSRPFDPEQTAKRAFTTLAGTTIRVPTMTLWGQQDVVLASGAGWKATELRYRSSPEGSGLAITLILPDDLRAFEAKLSSTKLATIQRAIAVEQRRLLQSTDGGPSGCGTYPYNVRLYLPRFGIDTRASLGDTLKALGMPLAFDAERADFSGMTTADRLHIGTVVHQANIDVDEKGTEAAAATAVGVDTGGCTGPEPLKTRILRLNRPFMFLLRDVQTGAILFMGRVTDPSQR
jgi:serpin B